MVKQKQQMDLVKMMELFGEEEKCRAYLAALRWPNGVACPRCGVLEHHAYDSERYVWDCYSCGYQFSVLAGTVFHDTKLPLAKWMLATLLMVEAKKGISANQMKRIINVSYKTAWYLCHRIRHAMTDVRGDDLLSGTVEVDETYVGGKVKGKGKGYLGNKSVVVGAVERDGDIVLEHVSANSAAILHDFIRRNTEAGTTIYTDEHPSYRGVKNFRKHDSVQHRIEEYVRGDVHTNSVEGVWSLFKRSIVGSFHQVSEKHLDAYLDELEWRFNNRENPYLFRDTVLKLLGSPNLPYETLVSENKHF